MLAVELSPEIISLLSDVFANYTAITKSVLFGSRAKGTAKHNSDIDIAIYGIDDELIVEKIALELDELSLPYKFDVIAFGSITNAALKEHICRVGVIIYEKQFK